MLAGIKALECEMPTDDNGDISEDDGKLDDGPDASCYSFPPYSWYLLAIFLSSFSCPFRYVFLRLGLLPNPLESV